jgi:hypothetical protein
VIREAKLLQFWADYLIDSKWLLAQQVLSGVDDIDV